MNRNTVFSRGDEMKLNVIFLEAGVNVIPVKYRSHPEHVAFKKKFTGKHSPILLDKNFHVNVTKKLGEKRGRLDLVHRALLTALDHPIKTLMTPDDFKVIVHSSDDFVLEFMSWTRIPRHYWRFYHLINKIVHEKKDSISNEGVTLIKFIKQKSAKKYLSKVQENAINVVMSADAKDLLSPRKTEQLLSQAKEYNQVLNIYIGAFEKGSFNESTMPGNAKLFKIHEDVLSTSLVTCLTLSLFFDALKKQIV